MPYTSVWYSLSEIKIAFYYFGINPKRNKFTDNKSTLREININITS